VRYMPRLPFIFEFQTEFGRAVERILRGRARPEVALGEAEAKINSIIARERAHGVIV
jgi:maltose-binding protein MalE